MKLTLLGRPDCHLCEAFEQELHERRIAFEHADVDSRPDWQRRWGLKIPVLLASDGSLICAGEFDAPAIIAAVAAALD